MDTLPYTWTHCHTHGQTLLYTWTHCQTHGCTAIHMDTLRNTWTHCHTHGHTKIISHYFGGIQLNLYRKKKISFLRKNMYDLCNSFFIHHYLFIQAAGQIYSFLMKLRTPEGAFKMHDGGEVDNQVRIVLSYCAASVARLTNIITPALFDGTPEWIVMCQSYEGGFGGCPGMEAHGGYSFCGLAALILLEHAKLCNIQALQRWTVNKQMSYEGGFQGRSNKLVDGCYSFWQGGAFPLIHMVLAMELDKALSAERWMFNQEALQEYILICCQAPDGGLLDKPGKSRDFYHTCYCLSGLSVAQHFAGGKIGGTFVVGHQKNLLKPIHPVFNIGVDASVHATLYFSALPVPGTS
ncbi:hypothetical protein ACJMK2_037957 [Sinanodonta woodiana]|uniref:Prenyltransferase alpha-alpha toroid domain-containing protein n=1 Tax=Sinanodonta woodiana TaxID=1069815 RepID=A0ABD3WM19_SINWO